MTATTAPWTAEESAQFERLGAKRSAALRPLAEAVQRALGTDATAALRIAERLVEDAQTLAPLLQVFALQATEMPAPAPPRAMVQSLRDALADWVEIADEEDKRDTDADALEAANAWLEAQPSGADTAALTAQELGTVLAALRWWEESMENVAIPSRFFVIATDSADFLALTTEQVGALADRLNLAGPSPLEAEVAKLREVCAEGAAALYKASYSVGVKVTIRQVARRLTIASKG
jgi:hypothetical protein